jgi:hypothetical protein
MSDPLMAFLAGVWSLVCHLCSNQYMHTRSFLIFLLQSTCNSIVMARRTQVEPFPTKAPLSL